MNYSDWLKSVPPEITEDSLWKVEAYRLALFVADLAWHDATKLLGDKRTTGLSSQLYEAVGSVSANISEGYSRGTGRDRARFYGYALGSGRESRGWYYKGRHVLTEKVALHRIRLLTEITRLLLKMIPDQRGEVLHQESPPYRCDTPNDRFEAALESAPRNLLEEVPMP